MNRPKGKGGERLAKNARWLKRQSHKLGGFLQIEMCQGPRVQRHPDKGTQRLIVKALSRQ